MMGEDFKDIETATWKSVFDQMFRRLQKSYIKYDIKSDTVTPFTI